MSTKATPSQSDFGAPHGGHRSLQVPARLHTLAALALLLEKLERQPRDASAAQYRSVVQQVTSLLQDAADDDELQSLLEFFPATGELWENLHYAAAGLCRAQLGLLAETERETHALLKRLGRHPEY
jgi:hypothetical protein